MQDYLNELNDVQREAVTTIEGPVLVVAGPGSGKTRVLTYRIANIIENGVPPWQILALTFTNKSAREMKERIGKVVGDRANNVWAGTFHSIFARILRVEADKIGYPSNFTIYDTQDSKSVISSIIKELNLSRDTYNVNAIAQRISSAKSSLIPPKLYGQMKELMMQDNINKRPRIHEIYTKYMAKCKRGGAMDFDDLLFQLYYLLHTNPDNVLEKYREKFKYLLVDEFQDTNYLQYAIIKKLTKYEGSKENICAVGDDAQSIYAFRGATVDNILDFEKDFKSLKTFKLEQNYRSTTHIVQAANSVIGHNKKQIKKKIWSHKGDGIKIKVIKAVSDAEEGKRIADTIIEQKSRYHLANNDIAILYRTNAQSRIFEEYLRRYNLPYKVFGGTSFYQRKEVKDLLGYLRLAVNQQDEEALKRVINYPKRGIGNSTLDKVSAKAAELNTNMWEAIDFMELTKGTMKKLRDFKKMIGAFIQKAETLDAYDLAAYAARQSGLIATLKADTSVEGLSRLENVTSLLDGIKEFVENDEVEEGTELATDKSLASYLQNIALHTTQDDEETGNFVTLMSSHSAKGLEFRSVFVVGLEENLFPSFMSMKSIQGIEEERRLFYVSITRAEEFLTLSFANSRYRHGKHSQNSPSRFLNEIPLNHLDSSFSMAKPANGTAERRRSTVVGNFKKARDQAKLSINVADFKPSPSHAIKEGQKVLHLKFGEGTVEQVDGRKDKKVATINFPQIDNSKRRLMLKFAKLQILEE
ncbi:MAG: UvrD-helicase domain-containing protein [Bacteroidota bacterium]